MSYNIHIGMLIKEQFEKRGCTVAWFARKLNCDRTNIYGIFNRETIDVKRLFEISEILEYDFFEVIRKEMRKEEVFNADGIIKL